MKTVHQGIDPCIFHVAPRSQLWLNRFVIFSGGKLEYRKGQDIVIAAFKEFHTRHPDALLITAWHNYWSQYMTDLDIRGYVKGVPEIEKNGQLKVTDWLINNGLLKNSLETIYQDYQTAQQRGKKAAEFMEDWTWEKQVIKLLQTLNFCKLNLS